MPVTTKKEGNIYSDFPNRKINIQKTKQLYISQNFKAKKKKKRLFNNTKQNIIKAKFLPLLWVTIFGKLVLLSDVIFTLYFLQCCIRYSPSLLPFTNNEDLKMS